MRRWTPFVISAKSKPLTDESRRRCLKQAAISAGTAPLASLLAAEVAAAEAADVTICAAAKGSDDESNPWSAPHGSTGPPTTSTDTPSYDAHMHNLIVHDY